MTACSVCLEPTSSKDGYHPKCLKGLFGRPICPAVDLGGASLSEAIATQAERISISGVQDKLIVDLVDEGRTIRPVESGRYILKVPVQAFKHLPQNEHLTMRLASLAGVIVPESCLADLPGGGLAYIVKRFDRTDTMKRRQEDFCSLLQKDPTLKYGASAEDCVEVVRKFSSDIEDSLRRLFRQFLYAFWIGNDDLHLKNLSLTQDAKNGYTLSPAYDLVCTRLYPQLSKGMALALDGRRIGHRRSHFVAFAARCGIDSGDANTRIDQLCECFEAANQVVDRSALPAPFRRMYKRELGKKQKVLVG
jgi:serine/threonine-protein kinase HipA